MTSEGSSMQVEDGRASTFVKTVDLPLLETLSEQFLQAIDYYGLIEVEYKLDLRDGHYMLLNYVYFLRRTSLILHPHAYLFSTCEWYF